MVRVPKEWDETCGTCKGSGKVHKRESFSLWTPEEYASWSIAPTPLGTKYGDIPANAVQCEAHAGATIFEACREGVTLARAYGRPVVFEFNDKPAVCHADAHPEDVAKRWWLRSYGKTYEQSVAER